MDIENAARFLQYQWNAAYHLRSPIRSSISRPKIEIFQQLAKPYVRQAPKVERERVRVLRRNISIYCAGRNSQERLIKLNCKFLPS